MKIGSPSVDSHSWKLAQEADAVLEERLDVVDAVFEHPQAIHAHSEGEPAELFRVVANKAVDRGIDHSGAEQFDPSRAFALPAARAVRRHATAAAENAGDVEFDARFGKREITGTKTSFHAGAEILPHEIFDGAGEIAERDVGIDGQPFNLVKHEGVRG